jgi:hypothetical protein
MEAKIDQLASSITSLIRSFLQTEVGEYRENYEYMLNSPLCRKLLGEIDRLKKENQVLSSQERPNIELEIMEDVEEVESPYEFDRKYKSDTSVSTKFAQIKAEEEVQEEEVEEASLEEVEVTDKEEGGEEVEVTEEEEVEEVEVTDDEEGGEEVEVTDEEEGEEIEVTDEEEAEEGEEVEVTDEEEEEVEEVEVTDDEEGLGETSQEEEEDDEEEEVFEFEYKGVMYFATDEVNGVLYACVDDDIGDEVGKIENKNVILY